MLTLGTEEAVPCASVFLGADVGGRDFEETVWTVVAVQLAGDTLFASDGIAFLAEEQRGEWMVVDAEDGRGWLSVIQRIHTTFFHIFCEGSSSTLAASLSDVSLDD